MDETNWVLESGDLDEVFCNNCGYASSQYLVKYSDNKEILLEFLEECPKCRCKMDHLIIKGDNIKNALKEALNKNNGKYSPNPLLMNK